jgi:hypothetical protein
VTDIDKILLEIGKSFEDHYRPQRNFVVRNVKCEIELKERYVTIEYTEGMDPVISEVRCLLAPYDGVHYSFAGSLFKKLYVMDRIQKVYSNE